MSAKPWARTTDVRGLAVHVGELHPVGAGFGEQSGDQCADLAGAENQYTMHENSLQERAARIVACRTRRGAREKGAHCCLNGRPKAASSFGTRKVQPLLRRALCTIRPWLRSPAID